MTLTPPSPKRIYLDNAAATPLHPDVLTAMLPYLTSEFGNASAIHAEGRSAKLALTSARATVARILKIRPDGVVFTGSGTESNNLALLGHLAWLESKGKAYADMEVITTAIEHPSILMLLPKLEALGVRVRFAPVSETGEIVLPELTALLSPQTVLVTFAYANSEIGTVQPVSRLVRAIRHYSRKEGTDVFVHLDAAQAPLWLPCALDALGVDALSLDAAKCGGPKGVGILALRGQLALRPILSGGGQEWSVRPGTENVAGIVGGAKALELAAGHYMTRAEVTTEVRDEAILKLEAAFPDCLLNGPTGEARIANNINISLPGFDSEYAVVYLDACGIAASTKSACAGAGSGVSHVVLTCTNDNNRARSTLRFSLGPETTVTEMEYVIDKLLAFNEKMKPLTKA